MERERFRHYWIIMLQAMTFLPLLVVANCKSTSSNDLIDSSSKTTIQKILSKEPAGTPVWFAFSSGDDRSIKLERELQEIFQKAGWNVQANRKVSFGVKPGIFLFAADENPLEYINTIGEALQAVGIKSTFGTGYRGYYEEMKRTNPEWQGFDMEPSQTFVLVIGPDPMGSTGSPAN